MAERENRQDGENTQSGRDGYKSYNREGYNDTTATREVIIMDVVRALLRIMKEVSVLSVLTTLVTIIMVTVENSVRIVRVLTVVSRVKVVIASNAHMAIVRRTIIITVNVLHTIRTLIIMLVRIVRIILVIITTIMEKVESNVHIALVLIMHSRVKVDIVRSVLVSITVADSKEDTIASRVEDIVLVQPTIIRMLSIA